MTAARFESERQVQLDLQRCAQLGGRHVDRLSRQDIPRLGLVPGADAKQPMDVVGLAAGDAGVPGAMEPHFLDFG